MHFLGGSLESFDNKSEIPTWLKESGLGNSSSPAKGGAFSAGIRWLASANSGQAPPIRASIGFNAGAVLVAPDGSRFYALEASGKKFAALNGYDLHNEFSATLPCDIANAIP